jgi:para-aminobenzoate synthetase/4-amino-4-deoxychorismate lyase
VFETILVVDGRPIELEAHIDRLAASLRSVYGGELEDPSDLVLSRSQGGSLGRLRLTVAPTDGGEFERHVVVAAVDPKDVFPSGPFASVLTALWVDRGQGEHKWADRDLLSRAEAAAGAGAVPLLVAADGRVLEASRANVFVVREGRLLTPPLDSSILPGIAREGVIEVAASCGITVEERCIDLDLLRGADEVFLTGSIRGVEPVREIDGDPLPEDGEVTAELAAGLRERWLGRVLSPGGGPAARARGPRGR